MSYGEGTIRFDHPRCQNFPVSHTLAAISNQPSIAVPAQINSSKNGLIPAAEAETNVQADSLHGNRPYYDVILVTAGELEKITLLIFFFLK